MRGLYRGRDAVGAALFLAERAGAIGDECVQPIELQGRTGMAARIENRLDSRILPGEVTMPSRRGLLKGLLGAGVLATMPFAVAYAQEKLISDEARDRIWANYPEMQDVVDLINEDENLRGTGRTMSQFIQYALYPDQGISNRDNIAITTRKVPIEDMDTPHYWLLLKIYPRNVFNNSADDNGNPGVGVPPPPSPPSGVWYFARGLRDDSPDNESDLLKALYIGATGSPEGAEPIINGTFAEVPGVRERAEEWRRSSPNPDALSEEGANYYAYLLLTLVDTNEEFINRELVDLSLGMLPEFYNDIGGNNSEEKELIYRGGVASSLTEADRLAGFHYSIKNVTYFPQNVRFD